MCEIVEVVCSKRSSVSFVTTVDTATSAIEGLRLCQLSRFGLDSVSFLLSLHYLSVHIFHCFFQLRSWMSLEVTVDHMMMS